MPSCLKVSLSTPGGKRVQLQIINSVTVKQKSRTSETDAGCFTAAQGFAAVFVAQTSNHAKPFN